MIGDIDWVGRFEESLGRLSTYEHLRRVLVGVSGGADSTALLGLIVELRARRGPSFPEVLVGHVHHGLRGGDADDDAEFVRTLAARAGLECLVAREDARHEARARGLSPEAAARAVRYRALRTWARERQLDGILLGHHQGDQAETVLLRAIRGAGVRGIAGIPPAKRLRVEGRTVWLLRPLLDWPRAWLQRYLEESHLAYREDPTNAERSIPRNRIRHDVLPLLERDVQAGAASSLARLGELARRVDRDLQELGGRALREAEVTRRPDSVSLSVQRLRRWPPTIVREALVLVLDGLGSETPGAGDLDRDPGAWRRSDHVGAHGWALLQSWLEPGGPTTGTLRVPGPAEGQPPARIELRYGELRVRLEPTSILEPSREAPLALDAPASWMGWRIEVRQGSGSAAADAAACGRVLFHEEVDAESVERAGDLRVRSRRRGEPFHPLGAPGRKPLKEFLRERRVWPEDRDLVPLVVAGDRIVWVVGHRISEEFRVREDTTRRLVLTASRPA